MKVVITAKARRDLFLILATSRTRFGLNAERRYRALLERAVIDLGENPHRPGVSRPIDAPNGVSLYHAKHARSRTVTPLHVGRARHVLVFRLADDEVQLLRVLHDAMDLPARLAELADIGADGP